MLYVVTGFLWISILLYLLLAGADFGAGILELVSSPKSKIITRKLMYRIMGPIWEANHMWLIISIVILFVGFPAVYTAVSVYLHIPLVLMLMGIIARGTAFSFRNYDAVKDVKSFQLNDEGPRGLALGCWYYIKMRPGLKEFLSKISELYELHVYTMGTRAYALNIAKIVDSDKKLFGDRIISRDENGSMTAKSLARLFPVDTKMVVIIDDRADVWPKNRPNLIKVHPYDFFLGIGDINSSFLPKREEIPLHNCQIAVTDYCFSPFYRKFSRI